MSDVFSTLPVAALSQSQTLFQLGLVVVLAAAAPLIAQVLRLPSILLLLALGFGAGAIGALDPSALLGEKLVVNYTNFRTAAPWCYERIFLT